MLRPSYKPVRETMSDDGAAPVPVVSKDLKSFYEKHRVHGLSDSLELKAAPSARFVRFNPRFDRAETLSLLTVCFSLG